MIKGKIIQKKGKYYNLTELGIRALHLIESYESDKLGEWDESYEKELDKERIDPSLVKPKLFLKKIELRKVERPKGLPPAIRTIPLVIGNSSEGMENNDFLFLPEPIDDELNPKLWIKSYINPLNNLLRVEKTKKWLEDRMLKLAYGTRGIRDYCILDSSLAVPPLKSMFNALSTSLKVRGKAGFFAKTGMGKSRLILYFSHWWLREYKTNILLIDNPKDLTEFDWEKLYNILSENISYESVTPRWMLIIEDLHLTPFQNLEYIRKIVSNSSPETWTSLIAFTEIPSKKILDKKALEIINSIKNETIPPNITNEINLNEIWIKWRPYFHEWIQWVALDVLFNQVPLKNQKWKDFDLDKYSSPWSFVVSLGFLGSSLENLQSSLTDNLFPLILYVLIATIFILR
ncbi:MAG: hypothetical protein ACFFD1_04155, partial [Candidatus Thorarchaeota archaeon]